MDEHILQILEEAGRTCYQSGNKIGCSIKSGLEPYYHCRKYCPPYMRYQTISGEQIDCNDSCEHHSSHKFVKMLNYNGHKAMLEFSDITVRFITNRGVSHELVRHRLCNFAESSTRYINYKDDMEFIRPVWCSKLTTNLEQVQEILKLDHLWLKTMNKLEKVYQDLLNGGWRPEQAREVLPNSLKTEIIVKANVREWQHILDLRCSKKAHPQMKNLLIPLLKELQERIPILFDGISAE